MKKVSQRAARASQKRVRELERVIQQQRLAYSQEWVGGVHIGTVALGKDDARAVVVKTARRLGHAVVVIQNNDSDLELMALPHPKERP